MIQSMMYSLMYHLFINMHAVCIVIVFILVGTLATLKDENDGK